ncbi:MAG: glycosyltransferase family 4 protein, partial [Rubrivivax sp.]
WSTSSEPDPSPTPRHRCPDPSMPMLSTLPMSVLPLLPWRAAPVEPVPRLDVRRRASARSLRVCFVGLENLPVLSRAYSRHGVGGEQVQHTLLARALARRGHEVSMVVGDYGQADAARVDGITLHKAHRLRGGVPVLRFFHPRLTGLWSALRRADADVYYLSCAGQQIAIAAAFARLHRRRLVFRIAHDRDCEPDALLVPHRHDRWMYGWGLRRADVVLAQSQQQAVRLKANYGLDSQLAAMLVDPPGQVPSFEAREVDVLWVNNLRPFKRPDRLLTLARALPHLRFEMIGGTQSGHEAMYTQIQAEAQTLPNLRFLGPVPYHEVNGHYERARVFVNTSDSEGFPNSYLQAWRRGTPSVAFFDPDAVIARHGLGAAVPDDDAMAAEVARLATQREPWAAAHRRCLDFMDGHYGDDRVLPPYLEALHGHHDDGRGR